MTQRRSNVSENTPEVGIRRRCVPIRGIVVSLTQAVGVEGGKEGANS